MPPRKSKPSQIVHAFRSTVKFATEEAESGRLLMFAAIAAIFIANLSFTSGFHDALSAAIGGNSVGISVEFLINDGLMTVFFFLVGLEIKREFLEGELRSAKQSRLPMIAAVGGMIVPALIYFAFTVGSFGVRGWGIPMATDIAFSLGVLALCGKSVPISIKIMLTALAIIDDIGAVLVIAFFYSTNLQWLMLFASVLVLSGLHVYGKHGGRQVTVYGIAGIILWLLILRSGIHATIAGILLALTIPIAKKKSEEHSLLHQMEQALAPWVNYGVMPLFALANAGIVLGADALTKLSSPVTMGASTGLVVGKALGIFGFSFIAIRFGLAELPRGAKWRHLLGAACLGGIGFTMSLFISNLAFVDGNQLDEARLGVVVGSVVAGMLGWLCFRLRAKSLST